MPSNDALVLYAAIRAQRTQRASDAEEDALASTRATFADSAAAEAEAKRLLSTHDEDLLEPFADASRDVIDRALTAACRVAFASGEASFVQSNWLEMLAEAGGFDPLTLEDRVASLIAAPARASEEARPEPRIDAKEAAKVWRQASASLRKRMTERVAVLRSLGFFADEAELSDEALATRLHARAAPVSRFNDWTFLVADPKRVWHVDFTGNDAGPAHGLQEAIDELATISDGRFAPKNVAVRRNGALFNVSFALGSRRIELADLIESPIHFDLSLIERLNASIDELSFVVWFDDSGDLDDTHHFLVLTEPESSKLGPRHLPRFRAKDFAEFRKWAETYGRD